MKILYYCKQLQIVAYVHCTCISECMQFKRHVYGIWS